jgi:hypothetical protein
MEMECDGDKDENYSSLLKMFWVFFTLWPFLTPLLFLLLLTKVKKSVQQRKPSALATICRFLWEDYDDTSTVALYWDVIGKMRKIFLADSINLLDPKEGSNKILRLSVACVLSTLYLTILMIVQPYKRGHDLGLATIRSFLLVMHFALGTILHLCEAGDDENAGTCHTLVGLYPDSYKSIDSSHGVGFWYATDYRMRAAPEGKPCAYDSRAQDTPKPRDAPDLQVSSISISRMA